MAVLYENDAFSTLVISTKEQDSSISEKVFVFRKFVSNVQNFHSLSHENMSDLSNGELLWKSLEPLFRRTYAPSVGFKMNLLRESFFQC